MRISKRFNKRIEKEAVLASSEVLDVIKKILQEDLSANIKEMRKVDNYDSPNWNQLIADYLATQRTLEKVIELINIRN